MAAGVQLGLQLTEDLNDLVGDRVGYYSRATSSTGDAVGWHASDLILDDYRF